MQKKEDKWREEMEQLRAIALGCRLTEETKWEQPCFTFEGKNVLILGGLKEFCVLSFFKGSLLKDPQRLLSRPGKHTQAGRWIKLTSTQQIVKLKPVLKAYILEAIAVEKAGLKVKLKKTSDYEVVEEFQRKLDATAAVKKAFYALTPGRQRGYLLYFAGAKQSKTREARVEKCIPRILAGKGLLD